ncbi:unnamed protein product, partial [marine sediment metagenome]
MTEKIADLQASANVTKIGPKSELLQQEKKRVISSRKMIEPLQLKGNEHVKDFMKNVFGGSGYNARRL